MSATVEDRRRPEKKRKVDRRTQEKLIIEHHAWVKLVAGKIHKNLPSNMEFDDLLSVGYQGLLAAAESYQPARGISFKTYAEFRVRGFILDWLREMDFAPRSIREKGKSVERARQVLTHELGRQPEPGEMAERLGVSLGEYWELTEGCAPCVLSLEDVHHIKAGNRTHQVRPRQLHSQDDPFKALLDKQVSDIVLSEIEQLPQKHRFVIALYYFEDLNLKEIGQILEVTESRVSQLHTQAVQWLRRRLSKVSPEFPDALGAL